jgi:hypothetical protein
LIIVPLKGWNSSNICELNESKFHSGEIYEQNEVGECWLSFGVESFVFQFAIKNIKIRICRTIILSVLCGCETRSLKLREESRLRVSENRMLRIIFGPMGKGRRIQVFGGKI